jgi:hypothetical protein
MVDVLLLQAEPFEPEVEQDADNDDAEQQQQQQQQHAPADTTAAAPAAIKPVPAVIRPKGLIPGAKPQPGKPAAAVAKLAAAAAAADGSSGGSAAADKAAALMKEFAQPAPAAGSTAKRVVKVGDVCLTASGVGDQQMVIVLCALSAAKSAKRCGTAGA